MGRYKIVLEKVSYEWHYPKAGDVYKLFTDEEGVVFILLGEELEIVTSEDGKVLERNIVSVMLQEFDTEEESFYVTLEAFVDEYVELDPEEIMDEDELEEFLNLTSDEDDDFADEDVIIYQNIYTRELVTVEAIVYTEDEVSGYMLRKENEDSPIEVSKNDFEWIYREYRQLEMGESDLKLAITDKAYSIISNLTMLVNEGLSSLDTEGLATLNDELDKLLITLNQKTLKD